MRYSTLNFVAQALRGHRHWRPAWRDASPKPDYDILIVGGGGHGLATAYYLAKEYGLSSVAVIEKGWIGSGNAGRNTTVIRSNYREPGNIPLYELSMKLWESLEQDLNYNAMVSQRGVVNLFHSDAQRDAYARRGNMMRIHGVDAELLDEAAIRRHAPFLDFDSARFPIRGGLLQRRGGTARHDAVVWGYARAADSPRRRYHPELRSHRHNRREWYDPWRGNHARHYTSKKGWAGGGRQFFAPEPPWPECACRSRLAFCRRW